MFARPRVGNAGPCPADRFRACGGCYFLCSCKESNQRNTPPAASRRCAPVPCAPRSAEGRCGNSLRSDTRTSSPSPDLRCSARSRRTQGQMPQLHPVDPRHAWMLLPLILIFRPALSEPSIAGESGAKRRRCLSAASSAPSPDSPRSAGHRRVATARGRRRVSFGYFSFRAKRKVTPLRGRGNDPPGMARRYRRVGAQTKTAPSQVPSP